LLVGKATLAKAEKVRMGVEEQLDYMVELHNDLLKRFPVGVLPLISEVSQRPNEQLEELIKGPLRGRRHIYTLVHPP